MQRLQKSILAAVMLSEVSHVFCCVLPVLFSIVSLLAGLGVVGVMPQVFMDIHDALHAYEVPMIIASGLILFIGWGLYFISEKLDCHDTGCGHGPCEPRKKNAHVILKIATILFLINISVYSAFHSEMSPWQIEVGGGEHVEHSHHNH